VSASRRCLSWRVYYPIQSTHISRWAPSHVILLTKISRGSKVTIFSVISQGWTWLARPQ